MVKTKAALQSIRKLAVIETAVISIVKVGGSDNDGVLKHRKKLAGFPNPYSCCVLVLSVRNIFLML